MVMMVVVMSTVLVVNMILLFMMMVMNLSAMPHLIVLMVSARVGAGLGLEGRLDVGDFRAEFLHHFLENVIFRDAQESVAYLHRHVPVSEVVGDLCKGLW